MTTTAHRVGDATVIKIPERALDAAEPGVLYPPQVDAPTAVEETRKLWPGSVDRQTGLLRQSIHAWLVRTPTRVILVDTGAGNDKDRPNVPNLNHLNEPFLDRLKTAGVHPEEVDLVLLTHLHVDHVGWNTKKGEQTLFWSDVMHHPLQFVRPDWNSVFCEFPEAARKSRQWAMNHAAETNALVFTTHFAESSVGRVSREGDRLTWQFA